MEKIVKNWLSIFGSSIFARYVWFTATKASSVFLIVINVVPAFCQDVVLAHRDYPNPDLKGVNWSELFVERITMIWYAE